MNIFRNRTVSSITKGLTNMVTDLAALADEKTAEMNEIDKNIDDLKQKRFGAMAEYTAAKNVARNIEKILDV